MKCPIKLQKQLIDNAEQQKERIFKKRGEANGISSNTTTSGSLTNSNSEATSKASTIPTKIKGIKKMSPTAFKIKNKIIAEGHRGTGILMVENSLPCFKHSIQIGLDSIELDIWLTTDNELVVVHGRDDDTLQLDDQSYRKIYEMSSSEIHQLYTLPEGLKIPFLRDVLVQSKGKINVNIEIKGKEECIAGKVIDLALECGMLEHIHISSFLHFHQKHLVQALISKGLKENAVSFGYLIWLLEDFNKFEDYKFENNILAFPVDFIFDKYALPFLFKAQERGMKLSVYFDFSIQENFQIYKRLCQMGINYIITNQPNFLLSFLRKYKNRA